MLYFLCFFVILEKIVYSNIIVNFNFYMYRKDIENIIEYCLVVVRENNEIDWVSYFNKKLIMIVISNIRMNIFFVRIYCFLLYKFFLF